MLPYYQRTYLKFGSGATRFVIWYTPVIRFIYSSWFSVKTEGPHLIHQYIKRERDQCRVRKYRIPLADSKPRCWGKDAFFCLLIIYRYRYIYASSSWLDMEESIRCDSFCLFDCCVNFSCSQCLVRSADQSKLNKEIDATNKPKVYLISNALFIIYYLLIISIIRELIVCVHIGFTGLILAEILFITKIISYFRTSQLVKYYIFR